MAREGARYSRFMCCTRWTGEDNRTCHLCLETTVIPIAYSAAATAGSCNAAVVQHCILHQRIPVGCDTAGQCDTNKSTSTTKLVPVP